MIDNIKTIRDFSTNSIEGKLLLAALAILTTISEKHLNEKRFGTSTHPDDALKEIVNLANRMYYEEEYKQWKHTEKRNTKIDNLLG